MPPDGIMTDRVTEFTPFLPGLGDWPYTVECRSTLDPIIWRMSLNRGLKNETFMTIAEAQAAIMSHASRDLHYRIVNARREVEREYRET